MAKSSPVIRFLEIAGMVGTCAWLASMLGPADQDAPTGSATFARLDDENSVEPQPFVVAAEITAEQAAYAGSIAGLGSPDDGELLITDAPTAPLKNRRIEVIRADAPRATSSLRAFTQNTRQRATRANRDIPPTVNNIDRRYRAAIMAAAALHNVPAQLIATKICIENPDLKARVVTGGGATGIMQIVPGTADDALRLEYRAGALSQPEAAYFRAKLGSRFDAILAGRRGHTTADLQNPEYCIHMGTLAFGQMLRKYTNLATGEVELYKAACEYNRGEIARYYNERSNSPDQLIAFDRARYGKRGMTKTTQQYIMLYCGPAGPLDYITRNNLFA